MSNVFIEINVFDDGDDVGYSVVLDSDGEPVVLCDGSVRNKREAADAIISALRKTIR